MTVAVAGYLGRSVLIPITLAVLLSFLLALLVNLLRRVHLDRIQCCLPYCGGLLGTQVAGLTEEVPRYALTNQQELDTVQQVVLSHMTTLTRSLVRNSDHLDVAVKSQTGRRAGRDTVHRLLTFPPPAALQRIRHRNRRGRKHDWTIGNTRRAPPLV